MFVCVEYCNDVIAYLGQLSIPLRPVVLCDRVIGIAADRTTVSMAEHLEQR